MMSVVLGMIHCTSILVEERVVTLLMEGAGTAGEEKPNEMLFNFKI